MKNINIIMNDTAVKLAENAKIAQKAFSSIPKDAFKNISIAQNLLAASSGKFFEKITEEQKKAAKVFKQIDFSQLSQAIATIQKPFIQFAVQQSERAAKFKKSMEYTTETISEATGILLGLGWWIYPNWTITSLRKIIDFHKAGKDGEIEKAIVDYFNDDNLDKMVKDWKSNAKLSGRMSILEDVIWAHKQGKYTLSVPTLLPHVEGIINENSGRTGRISHPECINILKDYVDKKFKLGSVSSLYPLGVLKFTETLLRESFEWGKPSQKGRHPILHGHYIDYDEHAFSLRLILLIDYIQNLI